jgi:hypothetical protein
MIQTINQLQKQVEESRRNQSGEFELQDEGEDGDMVSLSYHRHNHFDATLLALA